MENERRRSQILGVILLASAVIVLALLRFYFHIP